MNWLGNLVQQYVNENDAVLDIGCGIMQPLLDVIPTYPKTVLKCKRLVGLDIYQPYIDFLSDYGGIETLNWDLTKVPLPFIDKSFDVVLLLDILEHLPHMENVNKLLYECFRIARKKVIVYTPKYFYDNDFHALNNPYKWYPELGANEYQRHHILIEKEYLKKNGFRLKLKKSRQDNVKYYSYFGVKNMFNKILHVWDCAGVAGILSKYQNKLGYNSKVFIGNKVDAYGFDEFYDEITLKIEPSKIPQVLKPRTDSLISKIYRHLRYYKDVKNYINDYEPDIIHFHALEFIPLLFPFKKKIVEFHGTRLRRKLSDGSINENMKTPQWIFHLYKLLDISCLYSTPDLKVDIPNWINATYLSNPVDTDHFKRQNKGKSNTALYSRNHYEDMDKRLFEIKKKFDSLIISVLDREEGNFILHKDMPKFLSHYEYYIDRYNIKSLSKTALECLSMGIKVIDWKNEVIEDLPNEHDPFKVTRKTIEIYDCVFRGRKYE